MLYPKDSTQGSLRMVKNRFISFHFILSFHFISWRAFRSIEG
jgi:hypothetical protein